MSTTFQAPVKKCVTSITMRQGTDIATFSFPATGPDLKTLHHIVSLMIDGYTLDSYETKPVGDPFRYLQT